jgi:drug/metabolite transporter (DMT)-like permease
MGALSTVLPILTLFVGIAYLGASNASILSTLEPLITILLAAVLLKERVAPLQYLGGCLIVASVLLLQFAMRKTTPSVRLQDAAARS